MNFPSLMRAVFGILLTAIGAATITAVTVEGTKKAINYQKLQDSIQQFQKVYDEYKESKLNLQQYEEISSKLKKDIELLKAGIDPDTVEEEK